jgi:hypothetical protein
MRMNCWGGVLVPRETGADDQKFPGPGNDTIGAFERPERSGGVACNPQKPHEKDARSWLHVKGPYGTLINCPGHKEGIRRTFRALGAEESEFAGVAQLVEHLICNQRVGGSNPFASSR